MSKHFYLNRILQVLLFFMVLLFINPKTFSSPATGTMIPDNPVNQRTSLKCNECTLEEALYLLQKQTSINFFYNTEDISNINFRNLNFENEELEYVLNKLLAPNKLTYKTVSNRIVIKPAPSEMKGSISGTVKDEKTGELLTGATIYVKELQAGTATDFNGYFSIRVPEGNFSIMVSFIGYQTQVIEDVNVDGNNRTINLSIALSVAEEELQEVVVRKSFDVANAPIQQSTEISMMESIREIPGIATGISHQQIVRSLDRDAGQVVKRVAGVSLIDRFVLIRGLDPRYTPVQINGLSAPSSESDRRAFSFDVLPTGVIDQIIVYKSPAPELPGNFAGGVVQIKTKNTNIARRLRLGFSGQYRPGSSFEDYQTYGNGSSKDWLASGADDRRWGNRNLYDPEFIFPDYATYPNENIELLKAANYSRIKETRHNTDKRANLEYYDSWRIGSMRLNNLTSAFYSNTRQFYPLQYLLNPNMSGDPEGESRTYTVDKDYTDSVFTGKVRIGVMENLTLRINEQNQIDFNSLYNRKGTDQVVNRQGYLADDYQIKKRFELAYSQNDYFQGQLRGDHHFGRVALKWNGGYAHIKDDSPDIERYWFTQQDNNLWGLSLSNNASDTFLRTYSEETAEETWNGSVDLDFELTTNITLKTGGWLQNTKHDYSLVGYSATAGPNFPVNYYVESPWLHMDTILLADGYAWLYRLRSREYASFRFEDKFYAGYLALHAKLFNGRGALHGGVRYEQNKRALSVLVSTLMDGKFDKSYWLPSVSFSYNITRRQALRVSYGKTIDRPDYREMISLEYYDFGSRQMILGNPHLVPATFHNFDLRWEHYPSEGQFMALGLFYKRFFNAIDMFDRTKAGHVSSSASYENSEKGKVYGAELEFRRNLGFITPQLQNFSVIANAALIESEELMPDTVEWLQQSINGDKKHPMIGSSPYLVNAGLYFDQKNWGTQASVLYNLIGPRLRVAAGTGMFSAQYEMERSTVDFVLAQQITKYLSIKMGVQNIFNEPFRFYRDEDDSEDYNPKRNSYGEYLSDSDYLESKYKAGSYYSLGITVEF